MNLNLNETFLAVFVALATLSAVATGVGQWAARRRLASWKAAASRP